MEDDNLPAGEAKREQPAPSAGSALFWTGRFHPRSIAINCPILFCDFCNQAILNGPPDNCQIVKISNYSVAWNCPEYSIVPDLDTPEWWAAAKQKYGWTEPRLHGKVFTACRECSKKLPGSANESHAAEPDPAGGKEK
jgi:hypothetical protein